MFDKIKEGVKNKMREFLEITNPSTVTRLAIEQDTTHEVNVALNKIMYRGDAAEMEQAFSELGKKMARFWGTILGNTRVRKISSGIYKLIDNYYADLTYTQANDPEFEDEAKKEIYESIFSDDNELDYGELLKAAVQKTLVTGDGAFKISIDTELSQYPIIEFFDAEYVDYKYKRGKLQEVIFYTRFQVKDKKYVLHEHYGRGYIRYELYRDDRQVDLSETEMTSGLQEITFNGDYIMAVPLKFWESSKYEGRGEPFLDCKIDAIDALDECISQWMDALRAGRVHKYIPDTLIPRSKDGDIIIPNPYDNQFIKINGQSSADNADKIEVIQPSIAYEAYSTTYINCFNNVIMTKIAGCSLGVDSAYYNDNATAQRERREITAWNLAQIETVLSSVIPKLIDRVIKTYQNMNGLTVDDTEVSIEFDEYNAPGLAERVEIISKAAPGIVFMPYENIAEEMLYNGTEEEITKYADSIKEINNQTFSEPELFPNDFDKEAEQASE